MSNIRPPQVSILHIAASLAATSGLVSAPDLRDSGLRLVDYYRTRHSGPVYCRTRRKPRKRLAYPKCEPGTIAFHDLLVSKYGRRVADEIGSRYRRGEKNAIPRFE